MANHFDVLIVGAGLSGIGAARHLKTHCPDKSFAILEGRDTMGGTWDLFRYPGIRSDSDMYTLGYNFKPWTEKQVIADGHRIRNYIAETSRENGLDSHVRYGHKVVAAESQPFDVVATQTVGWRQWPWARMLAWTLAVAALLAVVRHLQRQRLARRRAEQQLRTAASDFYVVTLSPHAIGYKGMVLPDKLAAFYPDLQRAELASSAVVFHQRFSTNTLPRWPLAHPFRLLAHNGEINTIEGNRRWAQARSKVWKTPKFDIAELDPVDARLAVVQAERNLMAELAQLGLSQLPSMPGSFDVNTVPLVVKAKVDQDRAMQNLTRERAISQRGASLVSSPISRPSWAP